MSRSGPDVDDGGEYDAIDLAIGRYVRTDISIGKAAGLAGVDRWTFVEIFEDAGIEPRLGPQSVDETRAEAEGRLDEYLAGENE